jgi:hypothetical protein
MAALRLDLGSRHYSGCIQPLLRPYQSSIEALSKPINALLRLYQSSFKALWRRFAGGRLYVGSIRSVVIAPALRL